MYPLFKYSTDRDQFEFNDIKDDFLSKRRHVFTKTH